MFVDKYLIRVGTVNIQQPQFLKFLDPKFSNLVIMFENGEKFYHKTSSEHFLPVIQVNDLADYWITSSLYVKNPDYKCWNEKVAEEMRNFGVTTRSVPTRSESDSLIIDGEFNKKGAIKLAESILKALEK